jgi:hypothetical protein
LEFTVISLISASALRSAVICAHEADGPAAGVSGTLADGPAVLPVAPELHAASNVVAPRAAIASFCHRRVASKYCRVTVAV